MSAATTHGIEKKGMVHLGGALGIASCFIGLAAFMVTCFGYSAAMMMSPIPVGLSAIGFLLAIAGPVVQKDVHAADSHVFASIFLNVLGIMGGLLMMSAWLGWQVLPK